MSELQNERIIDHKKLSKKVYKTTYENGKSVIVNYNQDNIDINGIKIKGKDYKIITGEESKN
jgi:hypothetical protein